MTNIKLNTVKHGEEGLWALQFYWNVTKSSNIEHAIKKRKHSLEAEKPSTAAKFDILGKARKLCL